MAKKIVCILALFSCASAWADESADRAAIQCLIARFNTARASERAGLFTADAGGAAALKRLSDLDSRLSGQPWSEVTEPRVRCRSIRFVTPEVALVDAENTQYGSVILARRIPLLFVLRKEQGGWRIAALRVMDCGARPAR